MCWPCGGGLRALWSQWTLKILRLYWHYLYRAILRLLLLLSPSRPVVSWRNSNTHTPPLSITENRQVSAGLAANSSSLKFHHIEISKTKYPTQTDAGMRICYYCFKWSSNLEASHTVTRIRSSMTWGTLRGTWARQRPFQVGIS